MTSAGRVLVGHDPTFAAHEMGEKHPERPARSTAVLGAIERLGDRVGRYPFGPATRAQIERIHHGRHVDTLAATAGVAGQLVLDEDTAAGPDTYQAATLAAGSAIGAVDAVFRQNARAFSLARPPGHHAEVDRAMGYCFFNNIAIAAQHAIDVHGCRRVAIVDWDVHHGNGTQRAFEGRSDVLFVSSHQYKLFPGSGHYAERGRGPGLGYTLNLPLSSEATDDELLWLHRRLTLPVLASFAPDLLLISAGFDAHEHDETAGQLITSRGFGRLAALLFDAADRLCQGRVALVLEGGYHLDGLTDSVAAVLEAALDPAEFLADPLPPPRGVLAALLDRLAEHHAPSWPGLRGPAAHAPPPPTRATDAPDAGHERMKLRPGCPGMKCRGFAQYGRRPPSRPPGTPPAGRPPVTRPRDAATPHLPPVRGTPPAGRRHPRTCHPFAGHGTPPPPPRHPF